LLLRQSAAFAYFSAWLPMKASNASSAATLVLAIQISCNARFGLRLLALRQLGEHVGGLVHSAALFVRFRPDLAGGFQEPECAIGDDEPRRHVRPPPLQIEQRIARVLRALVGVIGIRPVPCDLPASRRSARALLFVREPCFEMDAINPDVDVALRRKIALLPRGVPFEPTINDLLEGLAAKESQQQLQALAPNL
jgi:hypothetical protein